MNVLFVLYGPLTSNSGIHVHDYANRLNRLGMSCVVAVPEDNGSVASMGARTYPLVTYRNALDSAPLFPGGAPPDVLHAWTPRERVRTFCARLQERFKCRQVIHLEDNEETLCSAFIGREVSSLRRLPLAELDRVVPDSVYHPVRGKEFLSTCHGVTVIIDRLGEFVPAGVPRVTLWASADETLFHARPVNQDLRNKLGIPHGTTVLAYTGNVHPANAREVRSLYLAAALMNRQGHPTMVIRTGADYFPFLGEDDRWCRPFVRELGTVERGMMPDVLAAADVLIQPGKPGVFNDYRFPSKLPEFFATGRPVVLPATNIGLHARHLQDAYVVPVADGVGIADAVRTIMGDPALFARLSEGARAFSTTMLDGERQARRLAEFYARIQQETPA